MRTDRTSPGTAFRVAERIRGRPVGAWDVYGESLARYEIHLQGREVEMIRGPIRLEGYGIRLLRPTDGHMQVGFSASSDASESGIERAIADAESAGRYARFPARSVELPSGGAWPSPGVETVDRRLWDRPEATLEEIVAELLGPFDGRHDAVPSFGSVRATLAEATLANSAGLARRFARTSVELELAVRTNSGPEGAAPGEYWVNRLSVRAPRAGLADQVGEWCQKARDARHAEPTPSGALTAILPADVLSDVLPVILGFRLGGSAELRGMAPALGTAVASERLSITDDGLFPYGIGSAPWDDEGMPQGRRRMILDGKVAEPLYDLLHANALGKTPTANGRRELLAFAPWFRFTYAPSPQPTTLVVANGPDGSDEELVERVRNGIWVDQLGYAFPDPVSSAFGGEIRLGYRIENGRRTSPIRGGTVGGVLLAAAGKPSVLRSIEGIGSEGSVVGRLSSPTIAVGGVSVAGAG